MSDQIARREVRLQTALAELWHVLVRREAEHLLEDLSEDRLRQHLFVGPIAFGREILVEGVNVAYDLVPSRLRIKDRRQSAKPRIELFAYLWHEVVTPFAESDRSRR
jgi:hypothetical protein